MRRRAVARVAVVLGVALLLGGAGDCSMTFDPVCTEIGCADGLTIRVTGQVAGPLTVTVRGGSVERSFTCPSVAECAVFFEEWTPEEVVIEVAWTGGARTTTLRPGYERFRPNGRRCPPECRQAVVDVTAG